jgi:hypothetical protein
MTDYKLLAYEDALGMLDDTELCARYELDAGRLQQIRRKSEYKKLYRELGKNLLEDGTLFRTKAAVFAESLLEEAAKIAYDLSTPVSVRLDAIKWFARVSGSDESLKNKVGQMQQTNITLPTVEIVLK